MTTSTPRIAHACTGPCNQGSKLCPSAQACGISAEQPTNRAEACAPFIGVMVASTIGALFILLGVWAWRSLT